MEKKTGCWSGSEQLSFFIQVPDGIRLHLVSVFVVELESVVDGKVQEHHWFQTVPVNNLLMSRIECMYGLLVLHIWQGYLTFAYYFISDRIVCVLVTFYMWGHFVMLIIKNLNLISVQSWTYLQEVHVFHVLQCLLCSCILSAGSCFCFAETFGSTNPPGSLF